jgi:hypothetical protein
VDGPAGQWRRDPKKLSPPRFCFLEAGGATFLRFLSPVYRDHGRSLSVSVKSSPFIDTILDEGLVIDVNVRVSPRRAPRATGVS